MYNNELFLTFITITLRFRWHLVCRGRNIVDLDELFNKLRWSYIKWNASAVNLQFRVQYLMYTFQATFFFYNFLFAVFTETQSPNSTSGFSLFNLREVLTHQFNIIRKSSTINNAVFVTVIYCQIVQRLQQKMKYWREIGGLFNLLGL